MKKKNRIFRYKNMIPNKLPLSVDLETKPVLKQLSASHRFLALLNGQSKTIPNENILINTLSLQEAKDSSAVENIITTHDELYRAHLGNNYFVNASAKEVYLYAEALKSGFKMVKTHEILGKNTILSIQRILEQNDAGYRRLPGTVLKNEKTGTIVYTPPQDYDTIEQLMDNLICFINDTGLSDIDPLIKMALIHHRFESIHPFYDGNGRTGRIINILYLVQQKLLDLPILCLSRYITEHKEDYYHLLQSVRETNDWEAWILFILKGIEQTAQDTISLIEGVHSLMQSYKHRIRSEFPKIYSQDLLNNLFKHPYTKIEFMVDDLQVSRPTATGYLNILAEAGFVQKQKIGRNNFYINVSLFELFSGKTTPRQAEPVKTITI